MMASPSTKPSLILLRLRSDEQWLLHHVLLTCLEARRRSPEGGQPPIEVSQALEKVEAGNLEFTDSELRRAREALVDYHRRREPDVPGDDLRDVVGIVDRIDEALTGARPLPSG